MNSFQNIFTDAAFANMIFKVHRLDRESSGLLLMGRTEESMSHLHWVFDDRRKANSSSKVYGQCQMISHHFSDIWFFQWLLEITSLDGAI